MAFFNSRTLGFLWTDEEGEVQNCGAENCLCCPDPSAPPPSTRTASTANQPSPSRGETITNNDYVLE